MMKRFHGFPDQAIDSQFQRAYDALSRRWLPRTRVVEAFGPFGATRVYESGPSTGDPVVFLSGHGETSMAWLETIAELSSHLRVIAIDDINAAGMSRPAARAVRAAADYVEWLDGLLRLLDVERCVLVGHSYGAWTALNQTIGAPDRIAGLVLVDPTNCLVGNRLPYLLRAVPLLLRPTPTRWRRFVTWSPGAPHSTNNDSG